MQLPQWAYRQKSEGVGPGEIAAFQWGFAHRTNNFLNAGYSCYTPSPFYRVF
jgi:hypothetical protein